MTDRRIFAFYVNPHTDELVAELFNPPHDDSALDRRREALIGQGVTQHASWYVGDAWNWGTSTMARWTYSKVSKAAQHWHAAIEKKREFIAKHN